LHIGADQAMKPRPSACRQHQLQWKQDMAEDRCPGRANESIKTKRQYVAAMVVASAHEAASAGSPDFPGV